MRRASAATLLVVISLVIAAPIWHHGHHRLGRVPTAVDSPGHGPHICATGGHDTPHVTCLVCFSERLLTQSQPEAMTHLVTPTSSARLQTLWSLPIGLSVARDERARAPPIA
jgi:hypothetical protein